MDKSENLELPYIMPNQAQKHVTHNEAIRYLDALVQISVESRELRSAPDAPKVGSRYIIAKNAVGEWAGKENQLAAFQDGAWAYYKPKTGWLAWVKAQTIILVFHEDEWQAVQSDTGDLEKIEKLGINTSADTQSRFGVSSNDSFFTHEGHDHRISINKFSMPDVGSLTFKTNWSGHAEMGLVGNNDLSIKVTPDGENWVESLIISAETGKVRFPAGLENTQLSAAPVQLDVMDFIYLDQNLGDDNNDGSSVDRPIKTLQKLEQLFPVGRRLQLRLMSDFVWDYAIRISYPIAMLEIVGRKADNSDLEEKLITVVDSSNVPNLPGCLQMNCISNVHLRSVSVNLDTTKRGAFLNFTRTLGYLNTSQVKLSRTGTGSCCLFADGNSFVANQHQAFEIAPSARGHVAQGVAAGKNPNKDWRYPSNEKLFVTTQLLALSFRVATI